MKQGLPRTPRVTRVVASVLTTLVAAGLAMVADAGPVRAGQPPDLTAPDRLTVVSQTPWVAPDGDFELRVAVADLADDETMRFSVRRRVPNRSQFAATARGEGVRAAVVAGDVDITADGTATIVVAGADLAREGVYPVLVDLLDGADEIVDRLVTYLVRLAEPNDEAVPLGVAVIVPIHARPTHVAPGVVDGDQLDALSVTIDAMATHPDLPMTVVATPETIASLAATNGAATSALDDAVEGSQTIGGTWVRLDPGSWARSDLSTTRQDRAGAAALAAAFGAPGDSSTWVAPAGVTRDSVTAAVVGGATAVVIDAADLEPVDADDFPITLTRPFEVALDDTDSPSTVDALAADTALADHYEETEDPVLAANRTLADLAVLDLDDPAERRVAVLRLSGAAAADRDFLATLLDGLEPPAATPAPEVPPTTGTTPVDPAATTTTTTTPAAVPPTPLVVAETVASALAAVRPAGAEGGTDPDDPLIRSVVDPGPAPTLGTAPAQLREADTRLVSYRTVFGPADPVAAEVEVVELAAASGDLSAEERSAMLTRSDAALDAELDGITGPPNQRVTFTARTGVVQLLLGNDTGRPADVTLRVRGDRLELPDYPDGVVPVHLAEATTRVDLRVRARASGDAPLDLRLTSPDGRIAFGQSRVTVRTTAVSGVGLVLLGTAAGFLLLWWTRTIVRDRRSHRHSPAHARPPARATD